MAAPFWIHCNMCNALLTKENKHYMLSCTHILCKSCMKSKNCALCKNDVRFEEISKLPEKLRVNFDPNVKKLLREPAKTIEFQQNHTRNFTKLTRDYKLKDRQLQQVYEKEKAEVIKLKNELEDCIKRRKLMQEKLKEVYMHNQLKKKHEIYRNPHNSTVSTGFLSGNIAQSSHRSSIEMSLDNRSNFFNATSQMGKDFSSSSNDFFGSSSNRKRQKKIEHTQSDRSPFFA